MYFLKRKKEKKFGRFQLALRIEGKREKNVGGFSCWRAMVLKVGKNRKTRVNRTSKSEVKGAGRERRTRVVIGWLGKGR